MRQKSHSEHDHLYHRHLLQGHHRRHAPLPRRDDDGITKNSCRDKSGLTNTFLAMLVAVHLNLSLGGWVGQS